MNRELATRLKEAGFPQREVLYKGTEAIRDMFGPDEPTLTELIEACGKPFALTQQEDGEWYAQNSPQRIYGYTPEEAVARLWLAINEK